MKNIEKIINIDMTIISIQEQIRELDIDLEEAYGEVKLFSYMAYHCSSLIKCIEILKNQIQTLKKIKEKL